MFCVFLYSNQTYVEKLETRNMILIRSISDMDVSISNTYCYLPITFIHLSKNVSSTVYYFHEIKTKNIYITLILHHSNVILITINCSHYYQIHKCVYFSDYYKKRSFLTECVNEMFKLVLVLSSLLIL